VFKTIRGAFEALWLVFQEIWLKFEAL